MVLGRMTTGPTSEAEARIREDERADERARVALAASAATPTTPAKPRHGPMAWIRQLVRRA